MKSLEELAAIRDRVKSQVSMRRNDADGIRILVGMATCGIAAGAKPVLEACLEEKTRRKLDSVSVTQTGCIGVCKLEPIMEVIKPGEEKVTYVKLTPEKVARIFAEHIVNNQIVAEYTIGAAQ
mgnify:CR=1 FL=1